MTTLASLENKPKKNESGTKTRELPLLNMNVLAFNNIIKKPHRQLISKTIGGAAPLAFLRGCRGAVQLPQVLFLYGVTISVILCQVPSQV